MWWLSITYAAELSGTLLGAEGEPVVGATVIVYDSRFNYGSATTRNGGDWAVEGLPADRYRVRFLPANADPHGERFYGGEWDACEAESVLLSGRDTVVSGVDDALSVGAEVSGRVTDLAGQPIEGARVVVYGAEPRTSLILRETVSDADGAFFLVGLDADPAGSDFLVYVQAAGWPDQWRGPAYDAAAGEGVTLTPGAPVDLATLPLLDGIRVSGRVSGTDGPVAGGTLIAYSTQQVLTEPIGSDGAYVADGLPPGDLVVWASSPGLATTYSPGGDRPGGALSVPDEGDDVGVDLVLPAESTLQLAADVGAAAEGVGVVVYNDSYTVGRGASFGPSGTLTVGALYPGDYEIFVSGANAGFVSGFVLDDAGDRVRVPVAGPATGPHTFELRPAATLSGVLTDDAGLPVYGASVTVTETLGDARTWSATSDRDGNWEILGVDATTLTLAVQYHWYCEDDLGFADTWYAAARRETDATFFVVPAGQPLPNLDLVLPRDLDHDEMGDAWEAEHDLRAGADDSGEDPDGDGFSNLEEWQQDSDPNAAFVSGDCGGGCAGAPGLLLVVPAWWRRRRRGGGAVG